MWRAWHDDPASDALGDGLPSDELTRAPGEEESAVRATMEGSQSATLESSLARSASTPFCGDVMEVALCEATSGVFNPRKRWVHPQVSGSDSKQTRASTIAVSSLQTVRFDAESPSASDRRSACEKI